MADTNFRARKGLTVGETQVTIDGTTGNIVTVGDVAVNGGDITTTSTTANIVNATATTVNLGGGAITAVNIGNTAGEIVTPSDIQQTGTKSIRQGNGPYVGSTDIYRTNDGVAVEGFQIGNNNMTSAEAGLVIRNYGQNISGGSTITASGGRIYMVGSRGTAASPLAINTAQNIAQLFAVSNLGDTTGTGNGAGFTNDLYPSLGQSAGMNINSNQNQRQTLQATFTGSISGTTLTVTAVASGTITPGHELRGTGFAVNNSGYVISGQLTSTEPANALGLTGTYNIAPTGPGTIGSSTMNTYSITAGSAIRFWHQPQNVPISPSTVIGPSFNSAAVTGGIASFPYLNMAITQPFFVHPVATRIITAITGGNTLNIGTHGFTTTGASFTVTTAGNPNGLTTGTTYFIDTIPSSTTVTLRTNSVSGGAVTGLTNGTGLFISATAAAINTTGSQLTSNQLTMTGLRRGQNYAGLSNQDNTRQGDRLGQFSFTGGFSTGGTNTQTQIYGQATQDWSNGVQAGSAVVLQSVKDGTLTAYPTSIGASLTTFRTDALDVTNTGATNLLNLSTAGNLTIAGDLRVNGNDIQNSAGNNNISLGNTQTFIRSDRVNFSSSNTSSTSNVQFTPGNNLGATSNERLTSYGLFHRRNPATPGEYPSAQFANWILNTGTGNFSPNLSGETLGDLNYSGQYSTTSTAASNGAAVAFLGQAAENFTASANGGRGLIQVVQIGTTGTLVPVFSGDSNNIVMKSGRTEVQTVSGTVLQRIDPTESRYRSARFVYGQVGTGSTIFDVTDNGSTGATFTYNNPYGTTATGTNNVLIETTNTKSNYSLYAYSTDGSTTPTTGYFNVRRSGGNNAATQLNDRLGQLIFNGNTNTGTGGPSSPVTGGEIRYYATENWTGSATGSAVALEVTKTGTTTNTNVFISDAVGTEISGDTINLKTSAGVAQTSAGIGYTRTYGEFAYTNAAGFNIPAQNTIYTMPLDTTLSNSGVTISGTGNININVSGWYKIIISLQITLTVSNQPGQIDFWLRKNGADVPNSKTQVDLLKDQKSVIAMDWLVNSNGTDYWEIVYVGTSANYADIDFPTIAATTTPYVSPVAPALIVNVIPAGM